VAEALDPDRNLQCDDRSDTRDFAILLLARAARSVTTYVIATAYEFETRRARFS
jgi:hypothetical protein